MKNTATFTDDEFARIVNGPKHERPKRSVTVLPREMIDDLRQTGGERLDAVRRDLSNAYQTEHNERIRILDLQRDTALLIASALGQAEGSPAHTLALQMLNEFDGDAVSGGDAK